jgi:hypothetical protein
MAARGAGAAAGPMPVIGLLNSQTPEGYAGPMRGLRQGLKDAGCEIWPARRVPCTT